MSMCTTDTGAFLRLREPLFARLWRRCGGGGVSNQSDREADENGVWARREPAVFTPAPPDHVQLSKEKPFY